MVREGSSNCCTNNVAMDKYRGHIGSRLADLYFPATSEMDTSQSLPRGFCALTIDNRPGRRKQNSLITFPNKTGDHRNNTGNPVPVCYPSSSSKSSVMPNIQVNQDQFPNGKMSLKNRLARVLFQKKRTCCRCNRKSRSCLPNKTFQGIEKHFTCSKCREASMALKNLFDGQSDCNHSTHSNSSPSHSFAVHNKQHSLQIPVEKCKDSGYETVTSCSTGVSTCSTFTTTVNKYLNKDNVVIPTTSTNGIGVLPIKNLELPRNQEYSVKHESIIHNNCIPFKSCNRKLEMISRIADQSNVLTSGQDKPLRCITYRGVKEYDGYLPNNYHHEDFIRENLQRVIPDATKKVQSSDINFNYNGKNIIQRNNSGKKCTSGQKACHICYTTSKVFFRLPWEGGWICEDCLDGLH